MAEMTEAQRLDYFERCIHSGCDAEDAAGCVEMEMQRRAGLSEAEHLCEALRRAFRTAAFRLECGLPARPA